VLSPPYSTGSTLASIHSSNASRAPPCPAGQARPGKGKGRGRGRAAGQITAEQHVMKKIAVLVQASRITHHASRITHHASRARSHAHAGPHRPTHLCAVQSHQLARVGVDERRHEAPDDAPPGGGVDQKGLVQATRVVQVEQRARLAARCSGVCSMPASERADRGLPGRAVGPCRSPALLSHLGPSPHLMKRNASPAASDILRPARSMMLTDMPAPHTGMARRSMARLLGSVEGSGSAHLDAFGGLATQPRLAAPGPSVPVTSVPR